MNDATARAAWHIMRRGEREERIRWQIRSWLKSIPQRFLPRELEKDPIFAPLQNRPDFKALSQAGG